MHIYNHCSSCYICIYIYREKMKGKQQIHKGNIYIYIIIPVYRCIDRWTNTCKNVLKTL